MRGFALRSRRVVLPDGERPATVVIDGDRIAAVLDHGAGGDVAEVVDLGDDALLPGLVDTHVHVNEPGRTEWEGFATATRAAAAGGVTTVVDMPLNSLPPTVDPPSLAAKRQAAAGQLYVDVGCWGGAVPSNLGSLADLQAAGVLGFKCFTTDSGVPEFPPLTWPQVRAALRELAGFDGLLLVHAEDAAVLAGAPAATTGSYPAFTASRPADAEVTAVRGLVDALRETGGRAHVLHVSAAAAADEVGRARAAGVRITAETCPHYLALTADDAGADASYKCCPPIRDAANREALWTRLADGAVDCVVSDHSPCPPELKHGGVANAWGGVSSLQLGLAVVWTQARARGHRLADVARWMADAPARLAGLPHKGRIAVGCDADLVAFAPDQAWVVTPAALHHRHSLTPYANHRLIGRARRTWLRGRPVTDQPFGRLIGGTTWAPHGT